MLLGLRRQIKSAVTQNTSGLGGEMRWKCDRARCQMNPGSKHFTAGQPIEPWPLAIHNLQVQFAVNFPISTFHLPNFMAFSICITFCHYLQFINVLWCQPYFNCRWKCWLSGNVGIWSFVWKYFIWVAALHVYSWSTYIINIVLRSLFINFVMFWVNIDVLQRYFLKHTEMKI